MEPQTARLKVASRFQLLLMAISTLILGYIIYKPSTDFSPSEPLPPLKSLHPLQMSEFGGSPVTIRTGVYIKQFSEFDIIAGKITFFGLLWFEYDPETVSLQTIENIFIEGGEILQKSDPQLVYLENKKMLARYHVRIRLFPLFDFKNFPYDDHRVTFWVTHNYMGPQELAFESSVKDFHIEQNLEQFGWRLYGVRVKIGYLFDELSSGSDRFNLYRPCALFSINYARYGVRYAVIIFLPMLLIFFMSLFTLSLDPKHYFSTMVGMSTGGISGLIAFRFIMENMSPQVAYFMISDYCFYVIFTLVFIIFFFNLFLVSRFSARILKFLIVLFHITLISSFAYVLLVW